MEEPDESPEEFRVLPHSVCVKSVFEYLQSSTEVSRAQPGYHTPALDVRRLTQGQSYKVHSPYFPSEAPQLDPDALRSGISEGSTIKIKVEQLRKWESRLRALVNMCSHMELFSAAQYKLRRLCDRRTICLVSPLPRLRPEPPATLWREAYHSSLTCCRSDVMPLWPLPKNFCRLVGRPFGPPHLTQSFSLVAAFPKLLNKIVKNMSGWLCLGTWLPRRRS